jgi:hypothetical protein
MRIRFPGGSGAAFAGAAVFLCLLAGPARADETVTATFSNISSGTNATDAGGGGGGVFNFNSASYSGGTLKLSNFPSGLNADSNGSGPTRFQAFCIETNENIYYGSTNTWTIQTDISKAPLTNGGTLPNGMGSAAAKNMEILFSKYFSTNAGVTASGTDLAAFQIAIWTIVNNSTGGSTQESFAIAQGIKNNNSSSVIADATSYLNFVQNNQGAEQADYLVALTAPGLQDQIGINMDGIGNPNAEPTPCPPAVVMALTGVFSLAGFGWRRRPAARP